MARSKAMAPSRFMAGWPGKPWLPHPNKTGTPDPPHAKAAKERKAEQNSEDRTAAKERLFQQESMERTERGNSEAAGQMQGWKKMPACRGVECFDMASII